MTITQLAGRLRQKNGRGRAVLPKDQKAIKAAVNAGTERDRIEVAYQALMERSDAIEQRRIHTTIELNNATEDGFKDQAHRNALIEAYNKAQQASVEHEARLKETLYRRTNADDLASSTTKNLRSRVGQGRVSRAMERVDLNAGQKLLALNNKIIYVGRSLASVTQVATAAAATVATLGAVRLVPLIASATQALTVFAALPAVLVAVGTGIAAMALGFSGVGGAVKAAFEAANQDGEARLDLLERERDAQRSLDDARESAGDTYLSGQRQLASAEKSVQSALKSSERAQKSLNDARKAAVDRIRAVNDALRGTALDERGAVLAAQRARQNLQDLFSRGGDGVTALDVAEAIQARDEADFNLDQVRRDNARKRSEAAETNQKGVEGDDSVVSAKEALADSRDAIVEAQTAASDTANQVAKANADAAERVVQAQEKVAEAAREIARGTSEDQKLAELMKKLSPNAQGLVNDLIAIKPALTDVKFAAQDALTDGLGPALQKFADAQLPLIKLGFAAINGEISTGLKNSLAVLSSPETKSNYATFLANTHGLMSGLANAAAPLTRIFVDLTTAGSAVLPKLGQEIDKAADKWSARLSLAKESGELNASIDRGIDKMVEWGHIIANVAGGIRGMFAALHVEGDSMTGRIVDATKRFEDWSKSAEGAEKIRNIYVKIGDAADRISTLLGSLGSAAADLLGPIVDHLGTTLDVINLLVSGVAKLADALTSWGPSAALVNGLVTALTGMYALRTLSRLFGSGAASTLFTGIGVAAINAKDTVTRAFTTAGTGVGNTFRSMQTNAATAVSRMGSGLSSMAAAIGGWFTVGIAAALIAVTVLNKAISDSSAKWEAHETAIRKRAEYSVNWQADVQAALNQSGGVSDENVRGVILNGVKKLREDLDADVANKSTFMQQYGEQFNDNAWWNIGAHMSDLIGTSALTSPKGEEHTPQAAARDRAADSARAVREALKELGDDEITRGVSGTAAEFANLKNRIGEASEGGRLAGERIQKMRDILDRSKETASRLTGTIADMKSGFLEAADAVDKLTSALDRQTSNNLTFDDARVQAYAHLSKLNGFTLDENGGQLLSGGELDATTGNGRELYNILRDIGGGYNELASAAYDANLRATGSTESAVLAAQAATEEIRKTVQQRLESYGLEGAALDSLLTKQGLSAQVLETSFTGRKPTTGTPEPPKVTGTSVLVPGLTPMVADPAQSTAGTIVPGTLGSILTGPAGQPTPATPAAPATPATPSAPMLPGLLGVPAAPAPAAPAAATTPAPAKTVPVAMAVPDYSGSLKAYHDYVDAVDAGYRDRLTPAFDGATDKATRMGTALVDAVLGATPKLEQLVGAIQGLGVVFRDSIADGALSDWSKLRPVMSEDAREITEVMLPSLVRGLDEMVAKFSTTTTGATTAFDGMKRAVAEPIKWLIDNVFNGALKNAWNEVRKILPALAEWTTTIPGIPGYYRGGVIPGYQPGVDDRVIAVGKGEGIIRPEVVRAYGPEWVHSVNDAARRGGVPAVQRIQGAYSNGGIVDSMQSAVAERWPNMSLTSGLRYTDNGYHSTGQAADFSNGQSSTPEMRQLAAWIRSNFLSNTLELIHHPFAHNVKNMRDVGDGMSTYGAGTMAEHGNHVHVALARALGELGNTVMPALGSNGLGNIGELVREKLLDPLAMMRQSMTPGQAGMDQVAPSMFDQVLGAVQSMLSQSSMDAGDTAFDVSAGARQWRPQIIAALKREGWEVNERNIALTEAQIDTESHGDPNIVQTVQDINSGGNEGVGLLQIIPGTFAAYRNPALPNDRTNPDANISAALRYYRSRWGDDLGSMWGKGHGYDQGGWLENGAVGWNMSGKREPVFTNEAWQTMIGQLQWLAGMVPGLKFTIPTGPNEFVDQLSKVAAAIAMRIRGLAGGNDKAKSAQKSGTGTDTDTDTGAGDGLASETDPTKQATMADPGAAVPDWVDPVSPADQGLVPSATETPDPYLAAAMEIRKPEHYQKIFDKAGKGFAEANWNQLTSDLGITGEGVLSQAVKIHRNDDKNLGVEYIQKKVNEAIGNSPRVVEEHIHYHVADMDEAMRKNAIRQRQDSMAFMRRGV
ncbi:transglycosylase SLT domain-containing protein [Nocardia sp.]|uniref:transglycosylase SLT domain-containing protein n=1 Tax=Nocardia sp. TaxID=1821 RepID=UPI0025912B6D|nr:transglycosylase SLT domain-containing protein [Nocardia sp.]